MMNVAFANALIDLLNLTFAYLITVGPVGYFRAWVAYKMGDDTLARYGLLTFNPLMHVDFFGILVVLTLWGRLSFVVFSLLLVLYFMSNIGRYIPINPLKIIGSHKEARYALAIFSNTIGYLVVAIFAAVLLTFFFVMTEMVDSSILFVLVRILRTVVFLNVTLCVLYFVFATVRLLMLFIFPPQAMYLEQSYIASMIISLGLMYLLLIFFGAELTNMFYFIIQSVAGGIVSLFGVSLK